MLQTIESKEKDDASLTMLYIISFVLGSILCALVVCVYILWRAHRFDHQQKLSALQLAVRDKNGNTAGGYNDDDYLSAAQRERQQTNDADEGRGKKNSVDDDAEMIMK